MKEENSMYEQFYIDRNVVPEVFLQVDKIMEKEFKNNKEPRRIIEKPMPRIEGTPGVEGPLYITEDWFIKKSRKRELKRLKEQKEASIEMINLLAQKDCIRNKIGQLDPSKKRNIRRIAAMNVRIKDIDAELKILETESGCKIDDIDRGSKFGRIIGRIRRFSRKAFKKVKKFYRRNEELITGMATIIIPVVSSLIVKSLLA